MYVFIQALGSGYSLNVIQATLKEAHTVVIKLRSIGKQWEQMAGVVGKMHEKLNEIKSIRYVHAFCSDI